MELLQTLMDVLDEGLGKVPAFLLAGLLGMLAHFVKKAVNGEVMGTAVDYFFRDYPGRSTAAVFTFGLAAAGLMSTGALEAMTAWTAAGCGFMTGWTANSAVNKGEGQ